MYGLMGLLSVEALQERISMSDEVKGRGQVGELIAQVFERYENEKIKSEDDFEESDPFIQT